MYADGMTKNVTVQIFERHTRVLRSGNLLQGINMEEVYEELARGKNGMASRESGNSEQDDEQGSNGKTAGA